MYRILLLVAALLLVGCQSDPEPVPPTRMATSPASVPETPTPTPTEATSDLPGPSVPSPNESFGPLPAVVSEDEEAVLTAWREYLGVVDWFLRNPEAEDYTDVQRVTLAGSEAAESTFQMISMYREHNWRLSGQTVYREIGVSVASSSPKSAVVSYCFDVSANEVLEADSGEVAVESQQETALEETTLQQLDDLSWRVVMVRNEVAQC